MYIRKVLANILPLQWYTVSLTSFPSSIPVFQHLSTKPHISQKQQLFWGYLYLHIVSNLMESLVVRIVVHVFFFMHWTFNRHFLRFALTAGPYTVFQQAADLYGSPCLDPIACPIQTWRPYFPWSYLWVITAWQILYCCKVELRKMRQSIN